MQHALRPERRPNFFIVGAPKCGTSSVYSWLSTHPNVFLSQRKEPNYFNADNRGDLPYPATLVEYELQFAGANDSHTVRGEATTWYLASCVAVPNILQYNAEAKFLVMLRNPVELARSMHAQEYRRGYEPEADFEVAWSRQAEILTSRQDSVSGPGRRMHYAVACALGSQLLRLTLVVPHSQLLIILLGDVTERPHEEYRRLLRFLDLPSDGRTAFPVQNAARQVRSRLVERALRRAAGARRLLNWLSVPRLGLVTRARAANTAAVGKPPISPEFRAHLIEYFRPEVALLEEVLGRDLSDWTR